MAAPAPRTGHLRFLRHLAPWIISPSRAAARPLPRATKWARLSARVVKLRAASALARRSQP
eukprot:8732383-Pyramimonas_sp.AAC.1